MNFDQVEKYRVVRGNWSTRRGEHCGLFFIDYKLNHLKVIFVLSHDLWQHVSVSKQGKCSTCNEMNFIKEQKRSDKNNR